METSTGADRMRATGAFTFNNFDLTMQSIPQRDSIYSSPWGHFRVVRELLHDWIPHARDHNSNDYTRQHLGLCTRGLPSQTSDYAGNQPIVGPFRTVEAVTGPNHYM